MSAKKLARKLRNELTLTTYQSREDLLSELRRYNYTTIINRRFSLAFKDEENRWHTINGLGGRFEYKKEPKIRTSKRIELICTQSWIDGNINLEHLSQDEAFIYALVSIPPHGKASAYIGQTNNLNRRINEHLNNIHPRWSFHLFQWSEKNPSDTYMVVLEHLPEKQKADLMEFVWVKTAEENKVTLPESKIWAMQARGNKPPYPIRNWPDNNWVKQHGILLVKRTT